MKLLTFNFFILLQVLNIIEKAYAGHENHVAFNCGRPSMIFQHDKWTVDFKQNCIKDEKEIVLYCQKTFPNQNITSAEPATESVKFSRWCDFNGESCELNVEVRPFKCLEFNFQSDALTLPKHCLFAHLGGKGECKVYKKWVIDAKEQCTKKGNWKLKSYGMLFQCGESEAKIKPMYFKGVEFVCCPNDDAEIDHSEETTNEQSLYNKYLSNGIFESKESEDKTYNEALVNLRQPEMKLKEDLINSFKEGENDLKKLWKVDPKKAKEKEEILISMFKMQYRAIFDQYRENKEQLLNYHDDRRQFIFDTRFHAALKELDNVLKRSGKHEMEILDAMKKVLNLLQIRKKELIEEQLIDETLDSHLSVNLKKELKIIEQNITNVFNKLDQVPESKSVIKRHLVMYLMTDSPPVPPHRKINRNAEMNNIIAKYRHRPESADNKDDGDFQVHYDLGVHDKDQEGHYGNGEQKFIFDRESFEKQYGDKRLLFGWVFGIMFTAFLILLIGAILIMYRHRSTMFKYGKPKFQDDACKQMMKGFGIESSSVGKDIINGTPFNVYENPTYKIIQTSLDTDVYDNGVQAQDEFIHENLSSPLIQP